MIKTSNLKKPLIYILLVSNVAFICTISNITKQSNDNANKATSLKLKVEELTVNISELENSSKELNKQLNSTVYNLENGGFKQKVGFDPNNITKPSNATREQLLYGLRDTKLADYVDTFLKVEEQYNINALAMIGLVANESSWLNSNRTLRQNNVTGYAVYSDSAEGRTFSSIEESILVTAKTLAENYINPNGKYYEGLATHDININYSADKDWCSIINSVATSIVNDINDFTDYLYK